MERRAAPVAGRAPARDLLLGLQAARGIAALLVVLFHAPTLLSLPQYLGYAPLAGWFRFGHAGVDFFFVLSGFIIMHTHGEDIGRPERLQRYARRRASRIYPVYWVVCALLLVMALFSADRAAELTPWHVLASLLLIPHGQEPFLRVAWTLQYEMLFYICFGGAILLRRAGPWLAAACVALVAAGPWLEPAIPSIGFLTTPYLLEFLGGVAAAMLVCRSAVPLPRLAAIGGIALFLVTGLAENAGGLPVACFASTILFGIASTMIVAGLAAIESEGRLHVPRVLVGIGAASYVIYLLHVTVIGLTARMLAMTGQIRLPPGWVVFALVVGVVVVTGVLFHRLVELPLLAWCRRPRAPGRVALSRP